MPVIVSMKIPSYFLLLCLALLVACSGQLRSAPAAAATPAPARSVTVPTGTALPSATALDAPSDPTPPTEPSPASAVRPTLGPGEWKKLPITPTLSPAMKEVYQRGLRMGNDPTHFSKIGDCQNVSTYFLSTFDTPGDFSLGGDYASLQSTIDHFQGSWSRSSLAIKPGFNVAAVLSPLRADPDACENGESPLACELRVWKPSIVIVSMETWWGEKPAETYAAYMRQVVEYIISQGAVPILATKADNLEGDGSINAAIAEVANEYDVPVWNYWAAVQPLPDKGLSPDGFHLTFARNFFDDPKRMLNAWPWRNLTALEAIDSVHRGIDENP
jgi:hypothetical protein